MIQLCAMISAARRRLGCVVLALELLYTAVQRHISSGPMIQLGVVISAARLRLGRVVLALTVLRYAASRRVLSDGLGGNQNDPLLHRCPTRKPHGAGDFLPCFVTKAKVFQR